MDIPVKSLQNHVAVIIADIKGMDGGMKWVK